MNTIKVLRLGFGAVLFLILSYSQAAATNISSCATFGAGSYTVINNISSAAINCLTFNAGPVTLDLGGFTVSGTGATNGVLATAIANVTVRNGTLKGFGRDIYATGTGTVIDGVRGVTGSVNGFTLGDNGTVQNSLVSGHTGGGITAGKNAVIVNNILTANTGNTIVVSDGSLVKGNTVTLNTGSLQSAIQISQNCKVVDNIVANSSFCVNATGDQNVINNNLLKNCVEGIHAGNNTTISGNNSSHMSDNGIEVGADCVISNNNASNNTGDGITAGLRTMYLNNVVNSNGNVGIAANANSSLIGNTVDNNTSFGIEILCPSKVQSNTALGNTPNLDETPGTCLNTDNLAP